jgi:hypothetical protein
MTLPVVAYFESPFPFFREFKPLKPFGGISIGDSQWRDIGTVSLRLLRNRGVETIHLWEITAGRYDGEESSGCE